MARNTHTASTRDLIFCSRLNSPLILCFAYSKSLARLLGQHHIPFASTAVMDGRPLPSRSIALRYTKSGKLRTQPLLLSCPCWNADTRPAHPVCAGG